MISGLKGVKEWVDVNDWVFIEKIVYEEVEVSVFSVDFSFCVVYCIGVKFGKICRDWK